MIKSKKGNITINGKGSTVFTDLAILLMEFEKIFGEDLMKEFLNEKMPNLKVERKFFDLMQKLRK